MVDPYNALVNMGKLRKVRMGPPSALQAIKQDLVKVDFDPSKAAAKLIRMLPKANAKSSQLVSMPVTRKVDIEALEAETNHEMGALSDPIRHQVLSNRSSSIARSSTFSSKRASTLSLSARTKSVLLFSANKMSTSGLADGKSSSGSPAQTKGPGGNRRKKKPGFHPHGFRYHSNGDERVSPSPSSTASSSSCQSANLRAEEATISFIQLARLRSRIMRSVPSARRNSAPKMVVDEEKCLQEELCSPGLVRLRNRVRSEPRVGSHMASVADLASRPAAVANRGTDNMFKRTILRHIQDMAQSKEALNRVSVTRVTSALSNGMMATGARGGAGTSWRQDGAGGDPAGRRKPGVTASASDLRHGDCLSDGNSSFNMRYGVPVKLMAQRKHILDEQHYKELEEAHKNNAEIDGFLKDVKRTVDEARKPDAQKKKPLRLASILGFV